MSDIEKNTFTKAHIISREKRILKEVTDKIFSFLRPLMNRDSKRIYVDIIETMYDTFFESLPDIVKPIKYTDTCILPLSYRGINTGINYKRSDHCEALVVYKILDIYKYLDIMMNFPPVKRGGIADICDMIKYINGQNMDQFLQENDIDYFEFLKSCIIYFIYMTFMNKYVKYVLNVGLITELDHKCNSYLDIENKKILFHFNDTNAKIISFDDVDRLVSKTEKNRIIDTLKPLIDKIDALIESIKLHPNNFHLFRSTISKGFNTDYDTYVPMEKMKESPVSPLEWSPTFNGGKRKSIKIIKTIKSLKTVKSTKPKKTKKSLKTPNNMKNTKGTMHKKTKKGLKTVKKTVKYAKPAK